MLGSETVNSVRNLGIVAWRDRTASLERMSGAEWNRVVRGERRRFNEAVNIPTVNERIPAYKASLAAAQEDRPWFSMNYNRLGAEPVVKALSIIPSSTGIKWAYSGTNHYNEVEDVTVDLSREYSSLERLPIYTIKDIGEGAQHYELTAKARIGGELWTKEEVGPTVAVFEGRAYYLKTKKGLWYYKCCSCDAYTGEDERIEYLERDHKYNLQLHRMHGGCPVLKADNNGYSKLFLLNQSRGNHLEQVDNDTIWQVVCGYADRFVLTTYGGWEYRMHNIRHPVDERLLAEYGDPYFYDYMTHTLLTQCNGVAYIHRAIRPYERWIRLAAIGGGVVIPDTFAMSSFARKLTLLVKTPDAGTYSLQIGQTGEPRRHGFIGPSINHLHFNRIRARSRDGTRVTAGYVKGRGQARGLLMVVYGAYGIPTTIGNVAEKWGPLLESGWAIGYAFVRGGGDAGWDWAEAGRRSTRERSLEDAEACLRALQRKLRVPAAKSIIYGRSAGGIQIGGLANRNPEGDLFAGVYGEVPYLDVLQTTTNPTLPLTELEYDEFGDPRHRLADLMFWVNHSPITAMPEGGLPNLFILCRTGLNDTQVYAYEPIKWIIAARGDGSGKPKILGIVGGQGHFYGHDAALQARAEDCAILDNFISINN